VNADERKALRDAADAAKGNGYVTLLPGILVRLLDALDAETARADRMERTHARDVHAYMVEKARADAAERTVDGLRSELAIQDVTLAVVIAEKDEARAALDRVRALHVKREYGHAEQTVCDRCDEPYPCATVRALDGSEVAR